MTPKDLAVSKRNFIVRVDRKGMRVGLRNIHKRDHVIY